MVLGRRRRRRKRSLQFRPMTMALNKNSSSGSSRQQKLPAANGTVTAQLNKSTNGTTVGSVAFVLNNPSSAYIWSNPLARVLTRNKSLQWQFGKSPTTTTVTANGASPTSSNSNTSTRPSSPSSGTPGSGGGGSNAANNNPGGSRAGQVANAQPARLATGASFSSTSIQQQQQTDIPMRST